MFGKIVTNYTINYFVKFGSYLLKILTKSNYKFV